MEKFASIPINLTDAEMAPADTSSRGFMTMVYENRLIALIIVLVVILLCVLAYAFWKRDGGKPAERQSPYRRNGGSNSGQNNTPKPTREELERLKAELDSDDESFEESEADAPREHRPEPAKETRVEEPKKPQRELPPNVKLADDTVEPTPKIEEYKEESHSEQTHEAVDESKSESGEEPQNKGGKVKCGNSICTRMVLESSGFCWQHRGAQK